MSSRPPDGEPRGLACPKCGGCDFRVTHTWRMKLRIRRRRVCRHCGRAVTTFELLAAEVAEKDRQGRAA